MPSFGRFLKSKYITYHQNKYGNPEDEKLKNIFPLWKGDRPTEDDLISQLKNPIQLELYLNNLEIRSIRFEINNKIYFQNSFLHADFYTGVEKMFGEIHFD
jgi:hypothetical protein